MIHELIKIFIFAFLKDQFIRSNQSEKLHFIEQDFNLYIQNRTKIDQELEYNSTHNLSFHSPYSFLIHRDLEASVEELHNDVKSKQCHVTINDVESFAFILSTISRSLVDLKSKEFFELNFKNKYLCNSFFSDITSKTFVI
jgi:hypothetical protein